MKIATMINVQQRKRNYYYNNNAVLLKIIIFIHSFRPFL